MQYQNKITRRNFLKAAIVAGAVLTTTSPLELLASAGKNPSPSGVPYFPNIHFETSENMFPISWKRPPVNGKAESLSENKIAETQKMIKTELSKYPEEVLRNLHDVYALDSLAFYGIPYAGTNLSDTIYIADNSEELLHKEFSSILLKKHLLNFDYKGWKRNNPSGFQYGTSGLDALKKGKDLYVRNEELLNEGFLNCYAQSTIVNDFNQFAGKMFYNNGTFWEDIEQFDRLKGKFKITLEFYQSLDKKLNLDYFKKISFI